MPEISTGTLEFILGACALVIVLSFLTPLINAIIQFVYWIYSKIRYR